MSILDEESQLMDRGDRQIEYLQILEATVKEFIEIINTKYD